MTTKTKSTKMKGSRKAAKAQPVATKKGSAKKAPQPTLAAEGETRRLSALDAAAQVLRESGQAMRAGELIAAMAEKGLWTSPNGQTPHATLYAALTREIKVKGKDSRFRKVDAGKFESVA